MGLFFGLGSREGLGAYIGKSGPYSYPPIFCSERLRKFMLGFRVLGRGTAKPNI
jgi:hypothetical protein